MPPLLQATRTVPIVFVQAADPVGNGFVASLARPGGNATGFTNIDFAMSGKWLELLKQIAPQTTRALVLRDASEPSGIGQWGALHSAAAAFGVEMIPGGVRDAAEIERGVTAFASAPNGALIITASAPTAVHRDLIVALAARHRLPAVYPYKYHAASGGLISYGPDSIDPYRRAATYVEHYFCTDRERSVVEGGFVMEDRFLNRLRKKARRDCGVGRLRPLHLWS